MVDTFFSPEKDKLLADADIILKNIDYSSKKITAITFAVKRFNRIIENYDSDAILHIRMEISKLIERELNEGELFGAWADNVYYLMMNGDAEDCCQRIKNYFDKITKAMAEDKLHIKITFICGVYVPENANVSAVDAFQRAEVAMILADRDSGFTDIAVYTEEIAKAAKRREIIEGDIGEAVAKGQLVVEVQPKYDLKTEKAVSAEALVRWIHPTLGRITPDEFIPIAEQTGDVIEIDNYVLRTICKNMRRWMDMGVNPVPIAVNQSRLHIAVPDYAESVFSIMVEYDVWPSLIELETTESIAFDDYDRIVDILKKFHSYGFILSMDDFGSGYSSLHMLSELEYDVLKIDQKIIRSHGDPKRNAAVLKHIIGMAHDLNMIVVAEGVEYEEQVKLLKSLDCDLVQGFFFAHPMSIEQFDATVFGLVT